MPPTSPNRPDRPPSTGLHAAQCQPRSTWRGTLRAWAWASSLAVAGTAGAAPGADATLPGPLLTAVNAYRSQQGLGAWHSDPLLTELASGHSRAMASQRQLSHQGFEQRHLLSGRRLCVENLAAGHGQADSLLAAWQRSAAHRANLLEPQVRAVGLATVDGYTTMLACTPAGAGDAPR